MALYHVSDYFFVAWFQAMIAHAHIDKVPKDYPQLPPTMKFTTPIYHPNGMCVCQVASVSASIQSDARFYH